jgi:F0F1-type ATP synthase membrane subunit b/b'
MAMRFWTAYLFMALGLATKAWSSSEGHGGHHASITDLIAPLINVGILFGVLIYATKDKLKNYFIAKSEEVANTIERADIKSKEAQLMLDSQKRKMANLEAELKNIHSQAEAEVNTFEKNLSKETEDKIGKMKLDANSKIAADKKQMMDDLNAELLQQVISKTKSTIKSNKDYQNKVSSKMLQGL